MNDIIIDEALAVLSDDDLKNVLECMLFVSPQPLTTKRIAQALQIDELEIDRLMHDLRLDFGNRGVHIIRVAEGYQMCTKPQYASYVSLLLKPERQRLSRAALETVAIVAYRQPITQPEVEAIRGVNSDGVMRTLTDRGLIRQLGKRDTPGRPMMYGTSEEFLCHFGLNDLSELPDIDTIELPTARNNDDQNMTQHEIPLLMEELAVE
ncbi:MAG: SMC-Scp complex subunit ScpB [Armatimonadota bacterium]